jgi:hypothetical protein
VFVLQNYLALLGPYGGGISSILAPVPLEDFDVLAVHYSNYLAMPTHFDPVSLRRIREFAGLKVAFIQDEYRTVNATTTKLRELGFDVLFTCVPAEEVEKVYPAEVVPGLRKISTLTGFVPAGLASRTVHPNRSRVLDVGYRARILPFWLGELAAEKWQIAARFVEHTRAASLRTDISYDERDRIYGSKWIAFLSRCRTVLGVESGASVFDFSGEIQKQVETYVSKNPGAPFEEIQSKFLREHEHKVRLNQVSPRIFEVAALRTGQVLYEGEYSGILKPGRHYIELRKDFSNIDRVVDQILDRDHVEKMAECTYEEIALNPKYSYAHFVKEFDEAIEREVEIRGTRQRPDRSRTKQSLSGGGTGDLSAGVCAIFARLSASEMAQIRVRTWSVLLREFISIRGLTIFVLVPIWQQLPERAKQILRPVARRLIRDRYLIQDVWNSRHR